MRRAGTLVLFILAIFSAGCGPNEAILKSNSNDAEPAAVTGTPSAAKYDSVESEVADMRTANFEIILVIRRKDGGVMQAEDKTFVRTTTVNANRRSLVEGGKAIVIGANALTVGEVVKKLSERFNVEDVSGPHGTSTSDANANIVLEQR